MLVNKITQIKARSCNVVYDHKGFVSAWPSIAVMDCLKPTFMTKSHLLP